VLIDHSSPCRFLVRAARADVDLALGMFVGQGSLALGFEGAEGDSAASDADAGSSLALALAVWHPVNNASADAGKREVISGQFTQS